jgi:hypothetical protein
MLEEGLELCVADAGMTGVFLGVPITALEPVSLAAVRISFAGTAPGASFTFAWLELTKRCSLAS